MTKTTRLKILYLLKQNNKKLKINSNNQSMTNSKEWF